MFEKRSYALLPFSFAERVDPGSRRQAAPYRTPHVRDRFKLCNGRLFMKVKNAGLFPFALILFCPLACSTPAGRSAVDVIDDSTITTKVKSKLLVRKEINLRPINVATREGAVTL